MESPSAEFPPSDPARPYRSALWGGLILVAGVCAAYANTFGVPLLFDDAASIADNVTIRKLWPPGDVLRPPANAGVGGRPVANLSFALNHAGGGLAVRGYHGVNLAIHCGAALALFGLVRRTLRLARRRQPALTDEPGALPLAWGAALLWALHPLHTESVTYLSQRTESLMGLFYLGTIYGFVRSAGEPRWRWKILTVACCLLGMATKEVMVTAPVAVLLYDRTFVAGSFRGAWRARRRLYVALAATWILLLFLLADVHERGIGHASVAWWEYGLTSTRAIVHYLRLAVWPAPLVFDYGTEVVRHAVGVWPQLLALGTIVTATAVALWRRPVLGFVGAWFLMILAPASSVVAVAGQTMAEHRMYLPLAALAAGAAVLARRGLGRWAPAAVLGLGAILGCATFARNRDYRNAEALWSDTVRKRPQNARAHAALGAEFLAQGRLEPAIAALERSLAIDPRGAEAHNNLATALVDVGRPEAALPHFVAAASLRPGVASTHYNHGNALLALGRTQEAIGEQRRALALRPSFPEASCALANALATAGQGAEAITHFRAALFQQADLTAAHFGLANALLQSGRFAEAVSHYEATLRLAPAAIEARYNLATALAQAGRVAEAIAAFEAVLKLQPGLEAARLNLEALRRTPAR